MTTNKWLILIAVALLSGLAGGYFIGMHKAPKDEPAIPPADTPKTEHTQTRLGTGRLTNPLLECDYSKGMEVAPTGYLQSELETYIAEVISSGKANHVSVYYRDLNNGPWFGIDEDEIFNPASLLKVAIMFAVLKKAETNPLYLQKKILCTPAKGSEFVPFKAYETDSMAMVVGKRYTVEELIERMITYSDNQASWFLIDDVGEDNYEKVFYDLQILAPGKKSADDELSVRQYSSFFRILYNASYLSQEMSEKALRFLSQTSFSRGLTKSLPPGTIVAHKYGQKGNEGSGNVQLHDCGIVYQNNKPYLICVMSRGNQYWPLAEIIEKISNTVFYSRLR